MLIDSHAHLDMKAFDADRDEVINRASSAGVKGIITIGTDRESSLKAITVAEAYSAIFATIGIHPHNADNASAEDIEGLVQLAAHRKVVAIGEIGLDFYRNRSSRKGQIKLFEQQLDLALSLDLPVVIHDREAHEEVLQILSSFTAHGSRGVVHCFSGDYRLAKALIDMGYSISIPGTVTYKNAHQIQDVAARVPLDMVLLETDAPFLTPVPYRGKRNEPSLVMHTAHKVAKLRNIPLDAVTAQTGKNVCQLFGISFFSS